MSDQENQVKSVITKSLQVIRMYDWLLDLYVLDFFVDDHWQKLPVSWRESFKNIDPQHLGEILSGKPPNKVLPLSFLTLIKAVEVLTIDRKYSNTKANITEEIIEDSCRYHPRLKNLFLKHVKLKKRHEINLMADVVYQTANVTGCKGVVDFGSGLGHLVRMLAYKYDLYAAGIECQNQLTEESRKLDLELEYTVSKHLSKESISKIKRPIHLNMTLTSHRQLDEVKLPTIDYGLVGLHPCGDLGPTLIRHFVECQRVKYICVVGCCFMKLNSGYPLSQFVKGLSSELSYVSREIACHAIEVYIERLKKGNYEDLKVHAYRAALERMLVNHNPELRHAPVRSIKHSNNLTFQRYCELALNRVSVPLTNSSSILEQGESDLQEWRRVVIMYTLRLAIAPLVETVILLDRVLYILENGLSCEIRPVFDPVISPRNHIIIARR